jgi:hypothetical protein
LSLKHFFCYFFRSRATNIIHSQNALLGSIDVNIKQEALKGNCIFGAKRPVKIERKNQIASKAWAGAEIIWAVREALQIISLMLCRF